MGSRTDVLNQAPRWLLHPTPVGAMSDEKLLGKVEGLVKKLPGSLPQLRRALDQAQWRSGYDEAANVAIAHVWKARKQIGPADEVGAKNLLEFAKGHMTERGKARVYRQFAKHASGAVRRAANKCIKIEQVREVALPSRRDGIWDVSGWSAGLPAEGLPRRPAGKREQQKRDLPVIGTIKQLRELLDIRSPKQLGWLLLASEPGPYHRFEIPKRDGQPREICAPCEQLMWVQRRLLHNILDRVPVHDAAHGFVVGRSIVTNAAAHRQAKVIVKFDLQDFFPTIHHFRVMGLFSSLGYALGDGCFTTDDRSRTIAPTLARLCSYFSHPGHINGTCPQGAPTSPAISNLVCRRLDARLHGLAQQCGGVYTRYADDLTFSFREDLEKLGRFRWWVDQICHQEGFLVNQSKFRVIRNSQRQTVTGIVVNDALRVPREQRRRFRAILHNCRRTSVQAQSHGNPGFADYLRGFASYIHMVHPDEGAELLRQVGELLDGEGDEEATS